MDLSKTLQDLVIQTPPPQAISQSNPIVTREEPKEIPEVDLMNEIGLAIKRR